eukprot:Selendium_serpulae@DN11309_c0_g1_i1.p1
MNSYYSELTTLAKNVERFPEPVADEEEIRKQWEDRFRVKKETGTLATFHPANERALEEWVDANAPKIKARGVCVDLFKELWAAVATADFSRAEGTIYEELVDTVALKLFAQSQLYLTVEEELWAPSRERSVHLAVLKTENTTARYLRLC